MAGPTQPLERGGDGSPPLLEARGISKAYPGVRALDGVDLVLWAGRVHALVGENGAGKSTLVGILGGVHLPDEGEILLHGQLVTFDSPNAALAAGIAVVYQELSLLPHLTVAENILLGHEPNRHGIISTRPLRARAAELLTSLGMEQLSVDTLVRQLSIAQRQVVEVAKALAHDVQILVMDEPSAVLAGAELERLFELLDSLRNRGVSIVYISHRLSELDRIGDAVTVLRDGQRVLSAPAQGLTRAQLVESMVGRPVDETFGERESKPGDIALEVDGLLLPGTEPDGLSLHVRRGEIVGVAGLMGSGRSRLARALIGLEPTAGGDIRVAGQRLHGRGPREAARAGLVLVPEDRKQLGLMLDFTLRANVSLPVLGRVSRVGVLQRRLEQRLALRTIDALGIRTSGPDQTTRHLSGGNQQKTVIGKWLATEPSVLVLDEPLRGVDVGAKTEIYSLIQQLAEEGAAILLISSELPEILGLSDRILVMHEGRIAGSLDADAATEAAILALAIGEDAA